MKRVDFIKILKLADFCDSVFTVYYSKSNWRNCLKGNYRLLVCRVKKHTNATHNGPINKILIRCSATAFLIVGG